MKYLLDTCFVSELIRKRPNPGVLEWIKDKDESNLYLSVITIGEIQKGIQKLPNSSRKEELETWLEKLQKRFEHQIIPIDPEITLKWGKIQGKLEKNGQTMPSIDGLIAATALVHNLTIVTHNSRDMEGSGVEIQDPWEDSVPMPVV